MKRDTVSIKLSSVFLCPTFLSEHEKSQQDVVHHPGDLTNELPTPRRQHDL